LSPDPIDVDGHPTTPPHPTVASVTIQDNPDAAAFNTYCILHSDLHQVYFSDHCYGHAFEESFTYMGSATILHPFASLQLKEFDGRVIVTSIESGTPCAKIP
jgi:hypothetical protein